MRQEPIYVINTSECVKNRAINNFNTSSDWCSFRYPVFIIGNTGPTTTGLTINDTLVNLVTKDDVEFELPLAFTDDYGSIVSGSTTFNIEVYKYNNILARFNELPITTISDINSASLENVTGYTINLDLTKLQPDSEYMVKVKFNYVLCTYILSRLGIVATTSDNDANLSFGNYNSDTDAYFIIITEPDKPRLTVDTSVVIEAGTLYSEQTTIENGAQTVVVSDNYTGMPIVVLNGLVLTIDEDYSITNGIIFFNDTLYNGDLVNVIYTFASNGNGINSETVSVGTIVSGTTDNEDSNKIFYNIDTSKFELFLDNAVTDFKSVIVTLNGVTLTNGIDFYQSTTNPKKIILNGTVIPGDLINSFYLGFSNFDGGVPTPDFTLFWEIDHYINREVGEFEVQLSTTIGFTGIIDQIIVPYEPFETSFSAPLFLPGNYGDIYYVRVINRKQFTSLNNETIFIEEISDTLQLTLTSNANNSY